MKNKWWNEPTWTERICAWLVQPGLVGDLIAVLSLCGGIALGGLILWLTK